MTVVLYGPIHLANQKKVWKLKKRCFSVRLTSSFNITYFEAQISFHGVIFELLNKVKAQGIFQHIETFFRRKY